MNAVRLAAFMIGDLENWDEYFQDNDKYDVIMVRTIDLRSMGPGKYIVDVLDINYKYSPYYNNSPEPSQPMIIPQDKIFYSNEDVCDYWSKIFGLEEGYSVLVMYNHKLCYGKVVSVVAQFRSKADKQRVYFPEVEVMLDGHKSTSLVPAQDIKVKRKTDLPRVGARVYYFGKDDRLRESGEITNIDFLDDGSIVCFFKDLENDVLSGRLIDDCYLSKESAFENIQEFI